MKQKGSANIVLILLVVVLVGALGYVILVKTPTRVEQPLTTSPSSLPASCVDKPETRAVITSLSSYSGPVGTKLEIRGCNFAGFEGDKNAWIENSQGVKGILYGEQGSTEKVIKVTLKSPLCSQDNSYSGLSCSSSLQLTPGTYKIWTMPWGDNTKSNLATFMIQ